MEIRSLTLPVEFPAGEAGLLELGRAVARLRTTRGIQEVSASGDKGSLRLVIDAERFSTESLEYELGSHGIRVKFPVIRRALLLSQLDSPEMARAISGVLRDVPGVLLANIDFAAAQGRLEYLASVSPSVLLGVIARFGVSARFADAPESAAPSASTPTHFPFALLALTTAVLLWVGGEAVTTFASSSGDSPVGPVCFALSALCAGGRPLRAAFRCLRFSSPERNAALAVCWLAGLAALGEWREAAAGLLILRIGEMALSALLARFRSRCRELPPEIRERLSASFLPSNPYAAILRLPALRGLLLVALLATGFAVAPSLLIPGVTSEQWSAWAHRGLLALPLASSEVFFLAASVAVAAALASGRESGLWFRGGAALKALANAKGAAYAKTGVLTQGDLVVVDTVPYFGWTCADALRVASILQSDRRHPMARALRHAAAPFENVIALEASDCVATEGGGAAGTVDDIRFFLGSRRWMQQNRVPLMRQAEEAIVAAEAQGFSVALLGVDGGLLGLMAFRDTVRADAPEAVATLSHLGIARQVLVSGDGASLVARTAQAMGLEATDASFGEAERSARIIALRQQAGGPVLALGDGVFDSALLDAADAAFCLNAGARPNAAFFASITAQSDDFAALPRAILLARRMDAALLRVWGLTLAVKAALLCAALLLPVPLPALVLAEVLLALFAAGGLLLRVPLRQSKAAETSIETLIAPAPLVSAPPAPVPSAPTVSVRAAPILEKDAEPTEGAFPEPLLELIFVCDPTADEEPLPDRVYPRWDSFVVPFYGEPLRFGRKYPTLSLAVQVEDEGVSRLHGEIRLEGKRPVVVDLRSSNGIRRNGKNPVALIPTETPTPLKFGDTLYLGRNTRIEVRAPQ